MPVDRWRCSPPESKAALALPKVPRRCSVPTLDRHARPPLGHVVGQDAIPMLDERVLLALALLPTSLVPAPVALVPFEALLSPFALFLLVEVVPVAPHVVFEFLPPLAPLRSAWNV